MSIKVCPNGASEIKISTRPPCPPRADEGRKPLRSRCACKRDSQMVWYTASRTQSCDEARSSARAQRRRDSKRIAPRFFVALVLISVIAVAIAAALTPSKVTGTLPGSVEDNFRILRSHPHIQDSGHPSQRRSRPGAASANGIDVQSAELRSSVSDPQISTIHNSENSGTRANQAGDDEGMQTGGRGDGDTGKERRGGDQRDLVADSKASPSEKSARQTKQHGRTGPIHRHLEPHNLTDAELFEGALAVGNNNSIGSMRAKVAFLFLTRGALPMAELWERFFKGHERRYSIYIHAAPGHAYQSWELPECFLGRHIPSQSVHWGGADLVDAERRLLANGLLDINNRRFILLSETCIPLHPFNFAYNYLFSSSYSFLTSVRDVIENKTWGVDMLPEVPMEMWRKGDQWKELHRVVALSVIQDVKYYKKFLNHFACPICDPYKVGFMDERYIPTFLHGSRSRRLANRSITWVDWKNHDDYLHPHTYDRREITPQLLKDMKQSTKTSAFNTPGTEQDCYLNGTISPCYLFARKFGADSVSVLLKLSKSVLGF